jgi:hypothetical protein
MQFNKNQETREKDMYSPHLMLTSINSWISEKSMVIAMLLKLVRMHRLGDGVMN